jgi:glycosyltransferase involved in cell wall biosynthesis
MAIEALRAGTAFVAAPVGGLPEIAAISPGCRTLAVNDAVSWTAALDRIAAEGAAKAESLRTICRNAFVEHFTARRMADQSLECYQSLLDRSTCKA